MKPVIRTAIPLLLLAIGAGVEVLWPEAEWTYHVLLLAGVILAAYERGVVGGVFGVAVTVLTLTDEEFLPSAHLLSLVFESAIAAGLAIAFKIWIERTRRSESKLRALVASMDEVLMTLDSRGTHLEITPTARPLLYLSPQELIGRRLHELFDKEQADFLLAQIRRALGEGTIRFDYYLEINGITKWFSASVSPLSERTVLWVARDITGRKLAEAALQGSHMELEAHVEERTRELRRSEERYRSVFDQAEEVIFTLSRQGVITSLNPAFEGVLGWSRNDWIGKPFIGLVPADSQAEAEKLIAPDTKDPLSRITVLAKSGARISLEVTVNDQVLQDKSVGFLGVARDVTEREEALAQLRRSQRVLADAERVAGVGSFEHDLQTNTLWWSNELFRMMGMEPTNARLPFSTFVDLVVEEDRPKLAEAQRLVLLRGEYEWETRVRLHDGSEKITCCAGRVVSEPGQTLRVVGIVKDETERRRSEQLLRESEERFRLITRATSDGVWDWDLITGKVWRGDGYQTLLGYSEDDLKTDNPAWTQNVHPDDREMVERSYNEAICAGEMSWSQEYRFKRKDGEYAQILDRAYIVRDARAQAVRMVGAMFDMTQQKQLEEQLEQAKRVTSLGRVAASIAHEFNNVLMGIQPNVEVIQRSSPIGLRHATENITRAVQRGKRVTDEILRFTRPVEQDLQSVSVRGFFETWRSEIDPLLGQAVELVVETDSDETYISADPLQLAQVFTNLALNARQAMEETGGKLAINGRLSMSFDSFAFGVVTTPDRFVHFTIRDEGSGISGDRLAHIFEPLFTTKRDGIGLGLAIAYQIVQRHDGHIFVESVVGRGTTFHVFIPAALPPLLSAEVPKQSDVVSALHSLLLVEDEPAVASGIAMLFETENVKVDIVTTGREAIPAIERVSPDAVILDIGLPDMDGVAVYLEIEKRWPDLPVLFSSGHGDSAKLEDHLSRPNVGFLRKPYDFEAMLAALRPLFDPVPA